MQKKNGISLIVLVITIIVMIILASVIIITLSNVGIITKAHNAVEGLDEAHMKYLVSLAWSEAYLKETEEIKDDAYYLREVMAYLKDQGITDTQLDRFIITATTNGADAVLKDKVKNEQGFYYNMMYTGMLDIGYTRPLEGGFVFFEDNKAICFARINDVMEVYGWTATNDITNEFVPVKEYGVIDMVFEDNYAQVIDPSTGTVTEDKMEFSQDGKVATFVAGDMMDIGTTFTLAEEYGIAHGVYFDKTYTGNLLLNSVAHKADCRLSNDGSGSIQLEAGTSLTGYFNWSMKNYVAIVAIKDAADETLLVSFNGEKAYFSSVNVIEEFALKITDNTNTIPEGGVYYTEVATTALGDYSGATATYTAGNAFPETVNEGDVYVYGDYEYRYNSRYNGLIEESAAWIKSDIGGWSARVLDSKKTSYNKALETINGKDVVSLSATYAWCKSLVKAPNLPATITDMPNTFFDCNSLNTYEGSTLNDGDFSGYKIPDNVASLSITFYNCHLIEKSPDLSNLTKLTNINEIFNGCKNLKSISELPENIITMIDAFNGCTSLESIPVISHMTQLEDLEGAFANCTNLKTYNGSTATDGDLSGYIIPSCVTDLEGTFWECKSIIIAPDLTQIISVERMDDAFIGCTSLTTVGNIGGGKFLDDTFSGCTSLTTVGSISSYTTSMVQTFNNCTALTGDITINAEPTSHRRCFEGTIQPIKIIGSCSTDIKIALAATSINGNVTY